MDTKFLQKVKGVLEKHYSNPQFSVEDLGKEVGLSTRHLLLKLKSLINQSPVEYIREFRLKKAAHLLSSQKATISEIAYETGFNDLSYFGKCFSKQYKMSPSAYVKKNYIGNREG